MQVCRVCKSDNLERTSSTGLRIFCCIVLLFIPFGLFFCWIPFVLEHKYDCNNCGTQSKASELLSVDWRERESYLEEYRKLESRLSTCINKWLQYDMTSIYKIVLYKGQLFAIEFNGKFLDAFRIKKVSDDNKKIILSSKVGSKFNIYKPESMGYSKFANETISNIEKSILSNDSLDEIIRELKGNNLLSEDNIDIEIEDKDRNL